MYPLVYLFIPVSFRFHLCLRLKPHFQTRLLHPTVDGDKFPPTLSRSLYPTVVGNILYPHCCLSQIDHVYDACARCGKQLQLPTFHRWWTTWGPLWRIVGANLHLRLEIFLNIATPKKDRKAGFIMILSGFQ